MVYAPGWQSRVWSAPEQDVDAEQDQDEGHGAVSPSVDETGYRRVGKQPSRGKAPHPGEDGKYDWEHGKGGVSQLREERDVDGDVVSSIRDGHDGYGENRSQVAWALYGFVAFAQQPESPQAENDWKDAEKVDIFWGEAE